MLENPIVIAYLSRSLIFLVLIYCAYFLLKPIIIRLIKYKCFYTLSYLLVSLCITSVTMIVLVLSDSFSQGKNQIEVILGSLWISIIVLGISFLVTFVAKILSQYFRNKNIST